MPIQIQPHSDESFNSENLIRKNGISNRYLCTEIHKRMMEIMLALYCLSWSDRTSIIISPHTGPEIICSSLGASPAYDLLRSTTAVQIPFHPSFKKNHTSLFRSQTFLCMRGAGNERILWLHLRWMRTKQIFLVLIYRSSQLNFEFASSRK